MNLVKIEITSEPIEAGRVYLEKATGLNKTTSARQKAYLHCGATYPIPFKVIVPDAGPYRAGFYMIGGDCFNIGQYGLEFRMNKLELVPVEQVKADLTGKPLTVAA